MTPQATLLYHGTLVPLQQAITEIGFEIEDIKKELREAYEDGGDTWIFEQALSHAQDMYAEMMTDFEETQDILDGLDG